jgi:hypothetical protein
MPNLIYYLNFQWSICLCYQEVIKISFFEINGFKQNTSKNSELYVLENDFCKTGTPVLLQFYS